MRWKKVTLIGVGLLGGSLGAALRQRRLADSVTGFVRRAASVRECITAGVVDSATRDLHEAVEGAELIVLCTPISRMGPLFEQMLPALKKNVIVTDVGSVKATVVRDLEPLAARAKANFVGSHPMAGAEKMGVAAARADLFVGAICVVTPTLRSNQSAVRKVAALWKSVGSRVMQMAPARHDELVSRSSHLPHIVAGVLANLVLDPVWPREQGLLCATGFRDSTRVASGSPEMWRDIEIANGKNLGKALSLFIRGLQKARRLIATKDPRLIEQFLAQAKSRRDQWREME